MADNGKLNPLLRDLRADLLKGRIEGTFEFAGRKFRMHTLSDEESVWRDSYVSMSSNMALISSRKCTTVAASISHIDDQSVDELFATSMPTDERLKGLLQNSEIDRRGFFRERVFEFLSQFDDGIVTEFFKFYNTLEERRNEVIKNLKNSSKGINTSPSSNTSSPADGPPAESTAAGSSFD